MPCPTCKVDTQLSTKACHHCLVIVVNCPQCITCPSCEKNNAPWLTEEQARQLVVEKEHPPRTWNQILAERVSHTIHQNQRRAAAAAAAEADRDMARDPYSIEGARDDAQAPAAAATDAAMTAAPASNAKGKRRRQVNQIDERHAAAADGPYAAAASAASTAPCPEARASRYRKNAVPTITLCLVAPDNPLGKYVKGKQGYVHVPASEDENALENALMAQQHKIDHLVIATHGDHEGPLLIAGQSGSSVDAETLAELIKQHLNKDATIWILSCHVGRSPPFIKTVAKITGCNVIAPLGYCSVKIFEGRKEIKSIEKSDTPAKIAKLRRRAGANSKKRKHPEAAAAAAAAPAAAPADQTYSDGNISLIVYADETEVIKVNDRILPQEGNWVNESWAETDGNKVTYFTQSNIFGRFKRSCG